ncbi:hypothetical protein HQ529_02735 [Candidatus Woesearchaeota archaeon]|nr:hypothetical protein [Candidatus Woesearchaeota archaeon]
MNFLKKSEKDEERKSIIDAPPPPPIPDIGNDFPVPPSGFGKREDISPPPMQEHKVDVPFPSENTNIEPPIHKGFPVPPKPEMVPETLHGYPPVHEPEHHIHKQIVKDHTDELEPPPLPPKRTSVESKPKHVDIFKKEYKQALQDKITRGPIYITVHHFRRINEKTNDIKKNVKEAEDTLSRLIDIEGYKNVEFEKWNKILKELQRKFILIDKKLFELNE